MIVKKQELRKIYLKKRLDLSAEAYHELNLQLLNKFTSINLNGVNCIHLFLPIRERREPDTFILIDWLKQNHPDIQLSYPKANFADNTMQHFMDDADLRLVNNGFGIPEPVAGNQIQVDLIDMVLVPMLAFNKQGYRVGYGKGFYDRFMAACNPGTQFIGLSFFEPVDSIDDVNEHDVPMHQCITTQKTWIF